MNWAFLKLLQTCPRCDGVLDCQGHHSAVCVAGGERTARHNAVCDLVHIWAEHAGLRPEKERPGLLLPQSPHDVQAAWRRPADVYLPALGGSPAIHCWPGNWSCCHILCAARGGSFAHGAVLRIPDHRLCAHGCRDNRHLGQGCCSRAQPHSSGSCGPYRRGCRGSADCVDARAVCGGADLDGASSPPAPMRGHRVRWQSRDGYLTCGVPGWEAGRAPCEFLQLGPLSARPCQP